LAYPYQYNTSSSEWTSGPQIVPNSTGEQALGFAKFGAGIGALALFGRAQLRPGYRGFDLYSQIARGIEEYSPGRVFRTFQVSQMLSSLETPSLQYKYFSPDIIRDIRATGQGRGWLDHLSRVTGKSMNASKMMEAGFRFESGQLLYGKTGREVLLRHAGVVRSPVGAMSAFVAGYARSLAGGPLSEKLSTETIHQFATKEAAWAGKVFNQRIPFQTAQGTLADEVISFTGGHSRTQAAGRFLAGYGTSLAERINQLARAPFELEPFKSIFEKVPLLKNLRFGVVPSSGLKTVAKITGKLGLLGSATFLGYQQLDYEARQSSLLDSTIFAEGITAGFGSLWTRSQLAISKLAELTGGHAYREAQEEVAPGSTELSRLLAFPIMGTLGGVGVGYAGRLMRQVSMRTAGLSGDQAAIAASAESEFFRQAVYGKKISPALESAADAKTLALIKEQTTKTLGGWQGKVARGISKLQRRRTITGGFLRMLGDITPGKIRALAGGALGLAAVAPFIPGALTPSTRPDELERLYSGQQQVAIKKGKWWEFGRCNVATNEIYTGFGQSKQAKDISLEDTAIGSDGQKHKILGIYKRFHQGTVVQITTCLDRNLTTGLTENHVLPVMKEKNSHGYHILKDERIVEEVEAGEIEEGDFVQVPIPQLQLQEYPIQQIELEDFIKVGQFIISEDKILPAQINWYTKRLQQSRGSGIPRQIELTHRLGRLFGYFLAEGNLSFKNGLPGMIETVHALDEKWIVDDIKHIVKSLFDIDITVRFKKGKKDTDEGCWIVRICNSLLSRVFFELFYQSDRSNDKEIPWWFLNTSRWFHDALLLGLWRGDGHSDRKRKVLSACRRQFIDFVQTILLSQGIVPTIPKVEKCNYIKKDGKNSYRYRIGWNPDTAGKPGQGYQWKNHKLYTRVIDVKHEYYNDTVYDFEIDHPDHLLQAGTFLVHNSPYEGTRIDRFRPHWYPRMLARAKEKSIYGDGELSPFDRLWKENFTYELEQKHYRERPYPITGTAFEDVPFIGPLLAATIGRLVKPPKLMHVDEWTREGSGGTEVLEMAPRFGQRPAIPELGEEGTGAPISPYGTKGVIGEQIYRMTEMVGLPGFTMTAIKESITGESDTFAQEMQLESARRMYGAERAYWDLELGGGLGTTELIRRLYPHRRRQTPLYNPIRNLMPEWLPGPGERSPDFLHGDPFVKVPEGELRLPGTGYAALHPNLEGVAPENYPDLDRLRILADVAPYTDKYRTALSRVRGAAKRQQLTAEEHTEYKEILSQVSAKKVRKQFSPYKYRDQAVTPVQQLLINANEAAKAESGPGWFERTVGSYWETLAHGSETPLEYLTPVAPASKLVHQRTAVEDYKATQLYGTQSAFWGHPIRDFFKPFIETTKNALGWEGIPEHIEKKRGLEDYFDILKYVKYTRLKRAAQFGEDEGSIKEYEQKRRETLFGINPFTFNFSQLYRSLPRRERDYFTAFSEANMEERSEIMKMVPENEKSLYLARWKLQDASDMREAIDQGLLSEGQVEAAEAEIEGLYREREAEGMPKTKDLWEEYLKTRQPQESYPDWYRRTKLLSEELDGRALPGPDWVGWHPAVDLDDIKLKIVENEGENMYDYDLWPDRQRQADRRPYLPEAAAEASAGMDADEVRKRINEVLTGHNIRTFNVNVTPLHGLPENRIDLNISEDRTQSIKELIRRRGLE